MTDTPRPSAKELYKVAQGFFQSREWDSAAQFYRSTLDADPDHRQARYQLGQALVHGGDLEGGIEALARSYSDEVGGSRTVLLKALVDRAKQSHRQGADDQALKDCERALEISPNHGQAYQLQMSIWMRRGDNALLRDDFAAAADAYANEGDDTRAGQVKKIHRWQDESDLEAQARSLELSKNWQDAASIYQKLLERAVDSEVKESWTQSLQHSRREAELLDVFDRSKAALEARDWESAKLSLLELVNRRPDYRRSGEWAIELLTQAIKAASAHFTPQLSSGVDIDAAPQVLNSSNAHRLFRLARLGQGMIGAGTFARQGNRLVLASSIGIYIYAADSLQFERFIDTDRQVVSLAVTASGDHIACGFADGEVFIWNSVDGALVQKLRGHAQPVRTIAFSENGARVATGSEDGSVRIWKTEEGLLIRQLEGRLEAIVDLAFSPDGVSLAFAAADDILRLGGVEDRRLDQDLSGHHHLINRVAYSPDGRLIASGSDDGEVRIWDAHSATSSEVLRGHEGAIRALMFSPQGGDLAVGLWNGRINIWKLSNGSISHSIDEQGGLLLSLSYSADGEHLLTTRQNQDARVLRTEDSALVHSFDEFDAGVQNVAFDAQGKHLAAGQRDGSIKVFDIVNAKLENTIRRHNNPVSSVAYSPNGRYLAAANDDGVVRIWQHERLVRSISASAEKVGTLDFSPDDRLIAAGTESGMIFIWTVVEGDLVLALEAHEAAIRQVKFSPGGSLLASAGESGVLNVWLASNGTRLETFEGFSRNISKLGFSLEGRQLICGTIEGQVRIWDTTTDWNLSNKFQVLAGEIGAMDASPIEPILATGDQDGRISLWDYSRQGGADKLLLGSYRAHSGQVVDLKFTADGTLLASVGKDGVVRLWGVVPT